MAAVVFLSAAFLFCTAQSQICGPGPMFPGPWNIDPGPCGPCAGEIYGPCGPYGAEPYGSIPALPNFPISQPPCVNPPYQPILANVAPPLIQNQIPAYPNLIQAPCPQFTNTPTPSVITNAVPQCATVATPVVTTTVVDNTLANSLANAIQLLIVSNLIENTLGSPSVSNNALAQVLGLLDTPGVNTCDFISPDFSSSPQFVSCQYPVLDNGCFLNDCPHFQESVGYPCPCVDLSGVSNFGPGLNPFPVLPDCNTLGFDNGCNTIFGLDSGSIPLNFGSGLPSFGCVEPSVATIAPMAVEVPFPASIPAQLTCNFGYIPTNVPCVSVNVEPLPFDGCSNIFGNGFFY